MLDPCNVFSDAGYLSCALALESPIIEICKKCDRILVYVAIETAFWYPCDNNVFPSVGDFHTHVSRKVHEDWLNSF